jgi:ribulose-bisphosphate carboxylase large chain
MMQNASQDRFSVLFHICVRESEAIEALANDIAIEQTVEAPMACIPASHLDQGILGTVEEITCIDPARRKYAVSISYRCDVTAYTVPQFFNTLFGNISLKNNICIQDISPASALVNIFPGPSFGIQGIRTHVGIQNRPLACTALKPMGLCVDALAAMAYSFAKGSIDFIKDDHGVTDQVFHPFEKRVSACQKAVDLANRESGNKTLYIPMVCGQFDKIEKQVIFARECGVQGIMVAPFLTGLDTMRYIAEKYKMILFGHPALSGTFFSNPDHGIAPGVLLGMLFRLLGADVSIFPHAGGRFPLTQNDCSSISDFLKKPMATFKSAFPCPAGGVTMLRIQELGEQYGVDFMFLIGGALITASKDLTLSTKAFMEKIKTSFGSPV